MDKEQQRRYVELQLLNQQIKQIQQQLIYLEQQVLELRRISESLNEIKKIDNDTEIYVPLGAGVFVKAAIKNNKKVLMNVGANVSTIKEIPDVLEIISNQINELENAVNEMNMQLRRGIAHAEMLKGEMEGVKKEK